MFVTPRDVRYYIGMLVSEPIEVFISFYVDWSLLHNNALLWTPQLRIMNFWPESRRMAPERPPGVGDGNVMEAEAAASLVEDDFWRSVETQFRGLRTRCGIREANLGGFVPPVFYYLAPAPGHMPNRPEAYFDLERCVALEEITRKTLGTHDPQSLDVTGGLLEGNLVTLRQDRGRYETSTAFFLLLAWGHQNVRWEEVENIACFVADRLSFPDFAAAYAIRSFVIEQDEYQKRINLWPGTLDAAADLVRRLLRVVDISPHRSADRGRAYQMVADVRRLLAKLEPRVLPVCEDIRMAGDRWA